jgi:hypothetical protein
MPCFASTAGREAAKAALVQLSVPTTANAPILAAVSAMLSLPKLFVVPQ